jgi:signal transduction histidine kinase
MSKPASTLAAALVAEIARLRALVSNDMTETKKTRYTIRRALEPMLTVSAAGGWPVSWSIPEDLEVAGSPADLAQVVHCLLVNATRHAPGTPIEISTRVVDGLVFVVVDDHGPGVPHAMRERIFHRGARAVPDQTEAGRGLGLFIARSLMRDEGGDLWVESRPEGGARFIAAVPLADPAATLLDQPDTSRISRPAPPGREPAVERRRVNQT